MQHISRLDYRKAFNLYLRKGIAIERTLQELLQKQERPTTHYIWRTRSDDKVRSAHAANNGKIFAFNNPPETGNHVEDYGCRCVAEPVVELIVRYIVGMHQFVDLQLTNRSITRDPHTLCAMTLMRIYQYPNLMQLQEYLIRSLDLN